MVWMFVVFLVLGSLGQVVSLAQAEGEGAHTNAVLLLGGAFVWFSSYAVDILIVYHALGTILDALF